MHTVDHVLVIVLAVIWPLWSFLDYPKFMRRIAAGEAVIDDGYRETIRIQWIATTVVLGWWLVMARPWSGIGLTLPLHTGFVVVAALAFAALWFLKAQRDRVRRGLSTAECEKLRRQLEPLRELVPRTPEQLRLFLMVAVTAGICEEVLIRGYLLWYAEHYVGLVARRRTAPLSLGPGVSRTDHRLSLDPEDEPHLIVKFMSGRRHLPIIALRQAA